MKLTDKILKMKQDMSDFDKGILTKLQEIDEIIPVVDNEYVYNGHITDINIEDNMIAFEVDCGYSDYVKTQLRYFNMSKEELIEEKQRLEEKNIIKMYNKKLSDIEQMKEQVEQMKEQLNVLKAEIVATQEEAEELKRLSERK
jgi:hypothetical protein